MPQINAALSIPLEPGRPAGAFARGPGVASAAEKSRSTLTVTPTILPPAMARPADAQRRETNVTPQKSTDAHITAVSTAATVVAR
jgi:cell division protein FtsI (penicillin-binding protein 3)